MTPQPTLLAKKIQLMCALLLSSASALSCEGIATEPGFEEHPQADARSTVSPLKAAGYALPACGSNPNDNTLMLQQAINDARAGTTLALAPGVCLLAKCAIARASVTCYNASGYRYESAVDIGDKTNLTLAGAPDGSSVLKLDPNPPRTAAGFHSYCGDAHVVSIQGSSDITLRGFTFDGSDGELPEDAGQCARGRISEHMHDVAVQSSTRITLVDMKITKAHGDGLNLIGIQSRPIPRTEHVFVTNSEFLDNDRAGITFQRNVGFVEVYDNYFKNSGDDQDLDMEPTGGPDDLGPYQVEIRNNLFERTKPGIAVTLGASSTKFANGLRFVDNTIRPAVGQTSGGCIFVYKADDITVANNVVVGGSNCIPLHAQDVSGLVVQRNVFEGLANRVNAAGTFIPSSVIRITERTVNRGDTELCGAPPKPPCPYFIHYPDDITIVANRLVQQVSLSPVLELSNVDPLVLTDNAIEQTQRDAPAGTADPSLRAQGLGLIFGVQTLPSYGYYLNERTTQCSWSITNNAFAEFDDAIRVTPRKAGVSVAEAAFQGNIFSTKSHAPQGILLMGASAAPDLGYIEKLIVNDNGFGCVFLPSPVSPRALPLNAYIRPRGQSHQGNIGTLLNCP